MILKYVANIQFILNINSIHKMYDIKFLGDLDTTYDNDGSFQDANGGADDFSTENKGNFL